MTATPETYVFVLQLDVEYEVSSLLGIFASRKLAEQFAQTYVDQEHDRYRRSPACTLKLQWTHARGNSVASYWLDVSFSVTRMLVRGS